MPFVNIKTPEASLTSEQNAAIGHRDGRPSPSATITPCRPNGNARKAWPRPRSVDHKRAFRFIVVD